MRILLLSLLSMLAAQSAQAQLTLCNRTNQPIRAAATEERPDLIGFTVGGWAPLAPGRCLIVAENRFADYAFFAHQPATGRFWQDGRKGPQLCVNLQRDFTIAYDGDLAELYDNADTFTCPAGSTKRGFLVLPHTQGELRYELK